MGWFAMRALSLVRWQAVANIRKRCGFHPPSRVGLLRGCPPCVSLTHTPSLVPSAVDRLILEDVQWGAVVLTRLNSLVGSLLPHEFETVLGRVLSLAPYVVLPAALPDSTLFSFWPSVEALVHAAARAADRVASVKPTSDKGGGTCEVYLFFY